VADAYLLSLAKHDGLGSFDRLLGACEQVTRIDEERFARFREANTVCAAVEEVDADLGLQVANLPTQRRLRDVEACGRSGKRFFFGDGDEVTNVPKLHSPIIAVRAAVPAPPLAFPTTNGTQVIDFPRKRGGGAVAQRGCMKITTLVGRILFSLLFIMSAPGNFKSDTVAYAASAGVPFANLAVPASGILALVGALSILLGYKARWGGIALIAFLVPVTVLLHDFWSVTDPMMHQLQLVNFMKNLALIGGALMFVVNGAGAFSLDARLARRSGETGGVALNAA
jgi:putative oxidoreductase